MQRNNQPEIRAEVDGDQAAAPEKDPKPKYRYLVAGILAASLACGGLFGFLFRQPKTVEVESAPPQSKTVDPLANVVLGDTELANGNAQAAITSYLEAKNTIESRPNLLTPLMYRLGVAYEDLGDINSALKYYRNADQHNRSVTSFASQLGEVRMLHRLQQTDLAVKVLSSMSLLSGSFELQDTDAGLLLNYTSALLHSSLSQAELPTAQTETKHLVPAELSSHTEASLNLVRADATATSARVPRDDELEFGVRIHGVANDPATTLLSCDMSNQPIIVLLTMLAQQSDWEIAPSRYALEIVSAKRCEIDLVDVTAAELLALTLEPLGLYWSFREKTVVIDRIDAFDMEEIQAERRRRAVSLLQQAVSVAPRHELAPNAFLAMGNLAVLDQQLDRARTHYQDIVDQFPKSSMAQVAQFNLAKTLMLRSESDEVINAFYDVTDQRAGTQLEALAYLFIGSRYIESDDFKSAKRELSRSLALGSDPEILAAGSMTLAIAYLLDDADGAYVTANSVLMEHREALNNPKWRDRAVFLSALTRYQAALRGPDVNQRGRELVTAAIRVNPSAFLGDFGYMLVGDVFSQLHLSTEAIELFRTGIDDCDSYELRDRLKYRLAVEYRKLGELQMAKDILVDLSKKGGDVWASQAYLEVADILQSNNRHVECIAYCRAGLERGFAQEKRKLLLEKLGNAYQELEQYKEASLCFAGFLPGDTATVLTAELQP